MIPKFHFHINIRNLVQTVMNERNPLRKDMEGLLSTVLSLEQHIQNRSMLKRVTTTSTIIHEASIQAEAEARNRQGIMSIFTIKVVANTTPQNTITRTKRKNRKETITRVDIGTADPQVITGLRDRKAMNTLEKGRGISLMSLHDTRQIVLN